MPLVRVSNGGSQGIIGVGQSYGGFNMAFIVDCESSMTAVDAGNFTITSGRFTMRRTNGYIYLTSTIACTVDVYQTNYVTTVSCPTNVETLIRDSSYAQFTITAQ